MILERIKVSGFRGIRTSIDFEIPAGFVVITGRNGSGKSTICDALEYTLTGKLTKYAERRETGETVENYLWWRGGQECDDKYTAITVNGKGSDPLTIRRDEFGFSDPPQEEILETFIDVKTAPSNALEELLQTCLIRDEFISELSLDIPERQRFTLVETTVGISDFSPIEDVASSCAKALTDAKKKQQAAYDELIGEANALAARRSELSSRLSDDDLRARAEQSLRNVIQSSTTSQNELITEAESFLHTQRRKAAALHTLISRIQSYEQDNPEDAVLASQDELDATKRQLKEAEAELSSASADVAKKKAELDGASVGQRRIAELAELSSLGERLRLNDGRCFLCGSQVDSDHYEQHLQGLKNHVESENAKVAALQAEYRSLSEVRATLDRAAADIKGLAEEIEARVEARNTARDEILIQAKGLGLSLDVDLKEARASVDSVAREVESSTQSLEEDIETLRASAKFESINSMQQQEEQKRSEAISADKMISTLAEAKARAENISRTIKRVSGETLDRRLAALAPLLKELYLRLRPHTEWRELEYLIRGDVRRFLSLRVGDDLNPAFMFSSGQRRAAGLAFLIAIHLSRTWSTFNTIVLDDPVQHVDDYRALHLVEVLAAIRRSGRQVICTVEDDALADLLCRRLRSESHGDGLRVEMQYKQGEGASIKSLRTIGPMPKAVLASVG